MKYKAFFQLLIVACANPHCELTEMLLRDCRNTSVDSLKDVSANLFAMENLR